MCFGVIETAVIYDKIIKQIKGDKKYLLGRLRRTPSFFREFVKLCFWGINFPKRTHIRKNKLIKSHKMASYELL
jgi:hypothetical protein